LTRFIHDRFAKQYLSELLSPLGQAEISRDVGAEVRQIDVLFVPERRDPQTIAALGWLGKMVATAALFEPFRNPVTAGEVRACISKLLDFQAEVERLAKRENAPQSDSELCRLWILTPTASPALRSGFGATVEADKGIYPLPESLKTSIVVIHQLPVTPETLWLRLLGRGNVQKRAVSEFKALPDGTPYKDSVLLLLADLFANFEARQDLDTEDREFVMQLSPLFQERLQTATEQGISEGLERGIEREMSLALRLLRRRFGAVDESLIERVRRLPIDRVEDLSEALFDLDSEADLVRWLDEAEG